MNTSLLSVAAVALCFVSTPALAQGADGPQFPNLQQVKVGDAASTQFKADPAEAATKLKAPPAGVFTADGPVFQPTRAMGAGRPRTDVKFETVEANRAGEIGHASTPY